MWGPFSSRKKSPHFDLMPLTDIQIRKAVGAEKDYKLSDAKGLYLQVTKRGAKYWRMKYRWLGKEKKLAIGIYPNISLKEAREVCERAKMRPQLHRGL